MPLQYQIFSFDSFRFAPQLTDKETCKSSSGASKSKPKFVLWKNGHVELISTRQAASIRCQCPCKRLSCCSCRSRNARVKMYYDQTLARVFDHVPNTERKCSPRCMETWSNTSASVWYNFSNKYVLQEKTKEKVWLIYASVWSQTRYACDFPLSKLVNY